MRSRAADHFYRPVFHDDRDWSVAWGHLGIFLLGIMARRRPLHSESLERMDSKQDGIPASSAQTIGAKRDWHFSHF